MTVAELIEQLKQMPQDAPVHILEGEGWTGDVIVSYQDEDEKVSLENP